MKRNVASPESRSRPATSPYVLKLVLYSLVYSCSRPSYRRTTELQWRTWIMVTALRQHPTRTIGSVVGVDCTNSNFCYRLERSRRQGLRTRELLTSRVTVRNRDRLRLAARRTAARRSILVIDLVIADSSRPRLAPTRGTRPSRLRYALSVDNDSTNTHEQRSAGNAALAVSVALSPSPPGPRRYPGARALGRLRRSQP
jgi:hypothetical protein